MEVIVVQHEHEFERTVPDVFDATCASRGRDCSYWLSASSR
jgi:hypothetical protein